MERIAILDKTGTVALTLQTDSVVQYARDNFPALQAERPELVGCIGTDLAGVGDVLADDGVTFLRGDDAAALAASRVPPPDQAPA